MGDFANNVIERRIGIGDEQPPNEATHNDLRLAVEALSGGLPLTIYARCWKRVRVGTTISFRS